MNKKKVFKIIATHMLTQNEVSADTQNCLYRNGAGLCCAIGVLINDDNYSEELEGHTVATPEVSKAVASSLGSPPLSTNERLLLEALQDIHDYKEPSYWRGELDILAIKHFKKDLEDLGVSA